MSLHHNTVRAILKKALGQYVVGHWSPSGRIKGMSNWQGEIEVRQEGLDVEVRFWGNGTLRYLAVKNLLQDKGYLVKPKGENLIVSERYDIDCFKEGCEQQAPLVDYTKNKSATHECPKHGKFVVYDNGDVKWVKP